MKRLFVAAAITAAILIPATAHANTNHDSTLAVSPAAPVVGDTLTYSGCGYIPGEDVTVAQLSPFAYSWSGGTAGDDGCVYVTTTYPAYEAGTYEAYAWQSNDHHPDATLTFTVSG